MKLIQIYLIAVVFVISCNDENRKDCIPNVLVNHQEFIALGSAKTEVGSSFVVNGGVAGIIVYVSQPGVYKAYDRQAPHKCPNEDCSVLDVDNTLAKGCDGSVFSLENGAPIEVANRALVSYVVNFTNSTLYINN